MALARAELAFNRMSHNYPLIHFPGDSWVLLGQDQLVILGDTQSILFITVNDQNFVPPLKKQLGGQPKGFRNALCLSFVFLVQRPLHLVDNDYQHHQNDVNTKSKKSSKLTQLSI